MSKTVDNSLNRLAYDISGLNSLKRQASKGTTDGIKKTAQQFESLFVNMMMQSMRKAVPQSDLFSSSSSQLFTSMFDQQIVQQSSGSVGKGFGLADMLIKQMTPKATLGHEHDTSSNNPSTPPHNESVAKPHQLLSQSLFGNLSDSMTPKALGQMLYQTTKQHTTSQANLEKSVEQKATGKPILDTVTQFINKWLEPAKSVSEKSGIPYEVIIAQAALETGWGTKPIKTDDGKQSHNYFGIKANGSWKGKTAEVTTSEYINGKENKIKDHFRVYDSPFQALEDYTKLLTQNERYQPILKASDAQEAAKILQDNNYATDPNYANKLIQLIERIKLAENNVATTQTSNSS